MKPNLTPRETRVHELHGLGLSLKQTAERLDISVQTVKNHRVRISQRLAIARGELIDETPHPGACE